MDDTAYGEVKKLVDGMQADLGTYTATQGIKGIPQRLQFLDREIRAVEGWLFCIIERFYCSS